MTGKKAKKPGNAWDGEKSDMADVKTVYNCPFHDRFGCPDCAQALDKLQAALWEILAAYTIAESKRIARAALDVK